MKEVVATFEIACFCSVLIFLMKFVRRKYIRLQKKTYLAVDDLL